MSSVFTKIILGEIPCFKIAESADCLAFLDINPLQKGHTLVIPKKEVDVLFDLPEREYHALFSFVQKIARAIKSTIPCSRVGVMVIGFDVAHAHIHLIPINSTEDLDFSKKRIQLSKSEMQEIANSIFSAVIL
jgi:histidine triad (HIT) family protein